MHGMFEEIEGRWHENDALSSMTNANDDIYNLIEYNLILVVYERERCIWIKFGHFRTAEAFVF